MRRSLLATVAAPLLAVAACGGGGASPSSSGTSGRPPLIVSAAASLKPPFTSYAAGFTAARVRLSFAGSDQLAAQIRQGARPDVFASANTKLPDQLYAAGKVEKPVTFAGNRLVLAVPASGPKVTSLADAARRGVTLAVGAPSVPVGTYTRTVLSHLPAGERSAILANVRSDEPDVSGVVGKIAQGAVDAGFVYVTDVRAAGGRLKAIALPKSLQPEVAYGIAIVKGAPHPQQARAFVAGLLEGAGRTALDHAGFERPPGP